MDIRQNLGAERSVSLPLPSRLANANASVKVARDRLQMTEQLRFLGRILATSLPWWLQPRRQGGSTARRNRLTRATPDV
jgi:hypothetical protein